jgi:GGDEF domain-containing protein
MTSRWVGLGAGLIAVVAGLVAALADRPWLGLLAAAGGAVAGLVALIGPPLTAEIDTPGRTTPGPDAPVEAPPEVVSDAPAPDPADLIDPETKLYREAYFTVAVASRISAARRHLRPVSVVLVEVARSHTDPRAVPLALAAVAVERTIRASDTACRLAGDRIGLVLEDTAEDGAVALLDRLRSELAAVVPEAVCWAGIACYPTHVFHAGEAQDKAARALATARAHPQHRVEVASAD